MKGWQSHWMTGLFHGYHLPFKTQGSSLNWLVLTHCGGIPGWVDLTISCGLAHWSSRASTVCSRDRLPPSPSPSPPPSLGMLMGSWERLWKPLVKSHPVPAMEHNAKICKVFYVKKFPISYTCTQKCPDLRKIMYMYMYMCLQYYVCMYIRMYVHMLDIHNPV